MKYCKYTYTSNLRFCFSSKKKSRTNFLTKSGFRVLSITSVLPNYNNRKTEISVVKAALIQESIHVIKVTSRQTYQRNKWITFVRFSSIPALP